MRIRGRVIDSETKEGLPSAHVYVAYKNGAVEAPAIGTTTDANGYFDLKDIYPDAMITASYTGYEKQTKPVASGGQFELKRGVDLDTFTVIAKKSRKWLPFVFLGIGIGVFLYHKSKR